MTFRILTALVIAALHCSVAVSQESIWEPMNRGLQHLLLYTLEVDPRHADRMFTGTDYGNLYLSSDGAFNWVLSSEGIPPEYGNEMITSLFLDPERPDEMYCGFGGRQSTNNLFRSRDGGMYWEVVPTPEGWKSGGVLHIHRSGGAKPVLFCGLGWYTGVWRSVDDGLSWEQKLPDYGVQVLKSNPVHPSLLFAGVSADGPLFVSSDEGRTWSRISQEHFGGTRLTGARAVTFSPDGHTTFVGITGAGNGLFKSTDRGASWTRLNGIAEISEISIHPDQPEIIYLSSVRYGVFRSLDGGVTWENRSAGLPTTTVMRVRVVPGYPVRVYAVTLDYGIYRMVDEELPEELVFN